MWQNTLHECLSPEVQDLLGRAERAMGETSFAEYELQAQREGLHYLLKNAPAAMAFRAPSPDSRLNPLESPV
jgi:hypothetical protein